MKMENVNELVVLKKVCGQEFWLLEMEMEHGLVVLEKVH